MKKKTAALFLTGIMMLAGCSSATGNNSTASSDTKKDSSTTETSENTDQGKVLVAYFSASGNTEKIAKMIAADTNADTFVITPAQPYTDDDLNYNNEDSRVVQEYENPDQQNIELETTDVPNWNSYNTVYLGYPIWWQDASWVVKSFVKKEDFTGKTVIPFATSMSSDLGDSGKNLEKLAGTGTWKEGQRFSSSASEDDVKKFVENNN